MPNHEEHCQHSFNRYGVRGDDIHTFLDQPCKLAGRGHRTFRHDTKTIKLVGEMFGKKYGKTLAENIALDHITADHEETIRNDKTAIKYCPHCGKLLTKSETKKELCAECGFKIRLGLQKEDIQSVKLPRKHAWALLVRRNHNPTLPDALPPLHVSGPGDYHIDEVYSNFEDKRKVEHLLRRGLNYEIVTVSDLKLPQFGYKSDNQIKELILESKTIMPEKIEELLNRDELSELKKHQTNKKDSRCFIATAAYGSPLANEINTLRDFRDKKLVSNEIGKRFVTFYYRTSPPIAKIIASRSICRKIVRIILNPIVKLFKRID